VRERELLDLGQVLEVRELELDRKAQELAKLETGLRKAQARGGVAGPGLSAQAVDLERQLSECRQRENQIRNELDRQQKRVHELEQIVVRAAPETTKHIALLREREAQLLELRAELETRRATLERRGALLLERESQYLNQPDMSDREIELAGLLAAARGREMELNRHSQELKDRESEWIERITQNAVRTAELERQLAEVDRMQSELVGRQDRMQHRDAELSLREMALQALEEQLQAGQARVQEEQLELERQRSQLGSNAPSPLREKLPDYLSDQSVLKADQLKLQERILAGYTTQDEDISSSVLM